MFNYYSRCKDNYIFERSIKVRFPPTLAKLLVLSPRRKICLPTSHVHGHKHTRMQKYAPRPVCAPENHLNLKTSQSALVHKSNATTRPARQSTEIAILYTLCFMLQHCDVDLIINCTPHLHTVTREF